VGRYGAVPSAGLPPDFHKLWVGQTISTFGSHFTTTGLPLVAILVFDVGAAEVGILAAAGGAGVLAASPVAGVWVDRLARRPIMIAADLGRALVLAWIPAGAALALLRVEHLYAVAFIVAALGSFFEVAYRSYLPALVQGRALVRANSRLAASDDVSGMAGPASAGAFVQALGAPAAMFVDAASFAVSSVSVALIRTPERRAGDDRTLGAPEAAETELAGVLGGVRAIAADPRLGAILGTALLFSFFGNASFGALYALFAIRELGLTPALLGLVISVGGLSALGGSLLAGAAARRFGVGASAGLGLLGYGVTGLLVVFASGPVLVAALMLAAAQLLDGLHSVYSVSEISIRQAITPDRLRGRVNAAMHVLVLGIGPLGAIAGAALAEAYGIRPVLGIGVAGLMASGALLLASPVRGIRTLPE
jgi:MFS family permease